MLDAARPILYMAAWLVVLALVFPPVMHLYGYYLDYWFRSAGVK